MKLYKEQEEVAKEGRGILDKWNMLYLALRPRYRQNANIA